MKNTNKNLALKTDEELVKLSKKGQTQAFDELIRRYYKQIYRYTVRTIGRTDVAEELTQEIFVKTYRSIKLFEVDKQYKFKSWLFTIAINRTRDYLRKYARTVREISLDTTQSEDEDFTLGAVIENKTEQPDKIIEKKELRELIKNLLLELPEKLREIIILAYYEKLSYNEIAELINIPLGTVKSRLHKAVQQFSKLWEEYEAKQTK